MNENIQGKIAKKKEDGKNAKNLKKTEPQK